MRLAKRASTLFHLLMIKPTHYDDDGYPIQWFRSAIPSNTLACLHGLAEDARQRHVQSNQFPRPVAYWLLNGRAAHASLRVSLGHRYGAAHGRSRRGADSA
jgi:hypothetical protein